MTNTQRKLQAQRDAKWAFEHSKLGRITLKDIVLMEMGTTDDKIDYIWFKNQFTGREYRVYDGWNIQG